jgi:hypothetical protein
MARSSIKKTQVLHIYHNQDADLYPAVMREDKIYLMNEKVAQFINRGVFTIRVHGKLPKKFKALIYLDGKAECAKLTATEYEEFTKTEAQKTEQFQVLPETKETIFEPLTDNDRITVVKREIAKQLGKFKPIETWQFILLIALIIGGYVINFIF